MNTKELDIEICKSLKDDFIAARDRFTKFAKQIAELHCVFTVNQIVKCKDDFTYRITKIEGFATDSDCLFGVSIKGVKVNKKTLKPTYPSYCAHVKLYENELVAIVTQR